MLKSGIDFRESVSVYPALASGQLARKAARMAMPVGDNRDYRLDEIFPRHWQQTAKRCGFPESELHEITTDLLARAATLDTRVPELQELVPSRVLDPVLEGVRRAARVLQSG